MSGTPCASSRPPPSCLRASCPAYLRTGEDWPGCDPTGPRRSGVQGAQTVAAQPCGWRVPRGWPCGSHSPVGGVKQREDGQLETSAPRMSYTGHCSGPGPGQDSQKLLQELDTVARPGPCPGLAITVHLCLPGTSGTLLPEGQHCATLLSSQVVTPQHKESACARAVRLGLCPRAQWVQRMGRGPMGPF